MPYNTVSDNGMFSFSSCVLFSLFIFFVFVFSKKKVVGQKLYNYNVYSINILIIIISQKCNSFSLPAGHIT